jgi:hypothetical protein
MTIMALLPPSSRMRLAKRWPVATETRRPTAVLPVKLISSMRGSLIMASPMTGPEPWHSAATAPGYPFLDSTSATIRVHATDTSEHESAPFHSCTRRTHTCQADA